MDLTVPPAFHPPSSLLGRLVRRWSTDARQAVSLYIVASALVLVVTMLAGQWSWVLWGLEADGSPNLAYFAVQIVTGLLVGGGCLLGWHRPVHVHAGPENLTIRRGAEEFVLPLSEIASAERIEAAAYHRHWSRYAATEAFVNRLPADLLLLRTAHGPVVLGLPEPELDRLDAHLAERLEPAHRFVRAA